MLEDDTTGSGTEVSGQSRHLRQILRAARDEAGLTQQQVADRISSRLNLDRPLTGAAVSAWEGFTRHPPINVMAAWARVLGRRLVVQLDDAAGDRVAVLVRPSSSDLVRMIDLLGDEDRRLIEGMVGRMKPRRNQQ